MAASAHSYSGGNNSEILNKRSRGKTSDHSRSASRPFGKRHVNPWPKDGNVTLAAQIMSFRVHASVLACHSDMLGKVLSDECFDRVDIGDCPVLHIDNDGWARQTASNHI